MQNKYLKYLLVIFAIILIVPQIALAAWYNPFTWNWNIFSWFSKQQIVVPVTTPTNSKNPVAPIAQISTTNFITISNISPDNNGSGKWIVNSDGSATVNNISSYKINGVTKPINTTKEYPVGTFDYQGLLRSINAVPDLTLQSKDCSVPASYQAVAATLSTNLTVTYNGVTSGNINCLLALKSKPYTDLFLSTWGVIGQTFKEMQK